jgi:hypothetical protein
MDIIIDPAVIEKAPGLKYEYRDAQSKEWVHYPTFRNWDQAPRAGIKAPCLIATLPDTVPPDTHLAMHDGILRPTLDSNPKIYLAWEEASDGPKLCWDEYAECWAVKIPYYTWTAQTSDPSTTIIQDASGWPTTKKPRMTFREAHESGQILRGKHTGTHYRIVHVGNAVGYAILDTGNHTVSTWDTHNDGTLPIPDGYQVEEKP